MKRILALGLSALLCASIPSCYSCRQHIHADIAASVVNYDRHATA